jgi:hypothetical protein
LVADDTRALHLFGPTRSVDDVPVTVGELHRLVAFVLDPDRIEEEPLALARIRVLGRLACAHHDAYPFGDGLGSSDG